MRKTDRNASQQVHSNSVGPPARSRSAWQRTHNRSVVEGGVGGSSAMQRTPRLGQRRAGGRQTVSDHRLAGGSSRARHVRGSSARAPSSLL